MLPLCLAGPKKNQTLISQFQTVYNLQASDQQTFLVKSIPCSFGRVYKTLNRLQDWPSSLRELWNPGLLRIIFNEQRSRPVQAAKTAKNNQNDLSLDDSMQR